MITMLNDGAFWHKRQWLDKSQGHVSHLSPPDQAREKGMAMRILRAHASDGDPDILRVRFDALTSHDITYVGIVQTARASGMQRFPVPYVLTNCHNSLCAVGGTINEDDHQFGLSAAKKYGGVFVPPHMAVIHQYAREMLAGCGKMILGSDSHTRYGALGTLGIGEGGPELVKQLLERTYDLPVPKVTAVYLHGSLKPGVGPQDVALALIKAVFKEGLVKNRILEFIGPGIGNLSVEYRMGIDVMTTETTCLTSIWETDAKVRDWLALHDRPEDYAELKAEDGTWYDGVISIDLAQVEPMIALPFHPSNAWTIKDFLANADALLADVEADAAVYAGKAAAKPDLRSKFKKGVFQVDQGVVAGCAGGMYENMVRVASVLEKQSTGCGGFGLSVYPASQPQYLELIRQGHAASLMQAGVTLKTAFCGPCFGAGEVPANNAFSIRHTTRNFPNREGSRPGDGQIAFVALMDARSIAATAARGGILTPATELPQPLEENPVSYYFDQEIYRKRVFQAFGKADPETRLVFGPNITDWPAMPPLPENLLLTVAAAIYAPVTTTDELIPSGETSSYRSNPLKLAEFALSRVDPEYVGRAKKMLALEGARRSMTNGDGAQTASAAAPYTATSEEVQTLFASLGLGGKEESTGLGSVVFALKPGDGSAREQAASCQKVLGGWANIAGEYATKRYRSNLVNWGMLPFVLDEAEKYGIEAGDIIFISGVRAALISGDQLMIGTLYQSENSRQIKLGLQDLTKEERRVLLAGCLMNYYAEISLNQ